MDDAVLVGSANLTNSALGWSSQPNIEILCRPDDAFDSHRFEETLVIDSREIGDIEYHSWISILQDFAPIGRDVDTSFWRPLTRDPRNLIAAYEGRKDEITSFDEQASASRDMGALLIPQGLTGVQVRAWLSACLLSAPITDTVLRLGTTDPPNRLSSFAQTYGLDVSEARRCVETVQNWLVFLVPDIIEEAVKDS
jgi:hypothetical protein